MADALVQAPEGTEIVVINEKGEIEPLATQEAAEIVISGDPIWCPDSVAPQAGVGGCTDPGVGNSNYDPTSLQSLLNYLNANQQSQAGTIWIEDSYVSSTNDATVSGFTIDGTSFNTMRNYDLTIQGGWDGTSGSTSITGTSTFEGDYLHVTNWNAGVTLNDIVVNGVTSSNHGIQVATTGDINLENVISSNNTGTGLSNGAYLDNSGGSGSITLTGTNAFNDNHGYGLEAYSWGDITLNNITAIDNWAPGTSLDNTGGTGSITLTGANIFNDNGSNGLLTYSNGNITLNNITASDNRHDGAYLENTGGSGSITLTGDNLFNGNEEYGLEAYSNGAITLNNVTASNNFTESGAYLDNIGGMGSITLTGTNIFNDNGDSGLKALSISNGDISAENVTASNNNGTGESYGVLLDNSGGTGSITLTGTNAFNGNQGDSLRVYSWGAITLNNITANNNRDGAYLDNFLGTGSITLTGTNIFNNNERDGLIVWSNGDTTLNNVTASDNNRYGAYLENTGGTGSITLTGTNLFNGNGDSGLQALSNGDISADNVTASDNNRYGAYLVNIGGTGSITLTGANLFNGNGDSGLQAYSNGDISADNVTANNNTGTGFSHGVLLDNTGGAGSITLTGTNLFNGNTWYGLRAVSQGNITLNNVTASNNNGTGESYGAYLGSTGSVTLTGTNLFDGNVHSGLSVYSYGDITLNNVTANNTMTYDGALLDNTGGTGSITLTGTNLFDGNGDSGLQALSNGDISADNVTASDNGENGAELLSFEQTISVSFPRQIGSG